LRGAAPHWAIEHAPLLEPPAAPLRLVAALTRPNCPDWLPLRDVTALLGDPLLAFLETAGPATDGDHLAMYYVVEPVPPGRRARALEDLTLPVPALSVGELVSRLLLPAPRVPRFDTALQRTLEARLALPAFQVTGLVLLFGWDRGRLVTGARSLGAVFRQRF